MFVPTRNPYRGLEAFERADVADFFGRDRVIAEMIAVLERERLLLVVGPSGIGKSSVVKAGLVPALDGGAVTGSESWLVTEMVPGSDPFEQAGRGARACGQRRPSRCGRRAHVISSRLDDVVHELIPRNTGLVIVIDQLEELFTQTVDEGERRAFLEMIGAARWAS